MNRLSVTSELKDALKEQWYFQKYNGTPAISLAGTASGFNMAKETRMSYTKFLFYFTNDEAVLGYLVGDLESIFQQSMDRLSRDPEFFSKLRNTYNKNIRVSERLYRNINHIHLPELSSSDLYKKVRNGIDAMVRAIGIAHIIEPFSLIGEVKLRDELKSYFGNAKAMNEALITLTTPSTKSFALEVEEYLRAIAVAKGNQRTSLIQQFLKRFYWIYNSYMGRKVVTSSDIEERVRSLEGSSTQRTRTVQQRKRNILKQVHLPERLVLQIRVFEFLTQWQDERKKNMLIAVDYFDRCLEALSRRSRVDISLLRYAKLDEFSKKDMPSVKELKDRRDGCICIQQSSGVSIYTGLTYRQTRRLFQFHAKDRVLEITGTGASLGTAIGKVKVCLTTQSLPKLAPGDILVASMTRPEYLPAMKKAAAFITDEGGMTCHAAIVAREMGKPCVIGTGNASQILHDGDIVEIKGAHGVVIIRRRKK